MTLKRHGFLVGAALIATLALAACGTDNNTGSSTPTGGSSSAAKIDCGSGKLTAQGSSAQKNAIDAWTKAYQTACPNASIDYGATGSGAGITAFIKSIAPHSRSVPSTDPSSRRGISPRTGSGVSAVMPARCSATELTHMVW